MIVAVQGLWHLGTVTAACLAQAGHQVIGIDDDVATIERLRGGAAPVAEPGLDALLQQQEILFTTDATVAGRAEVVWVAYDTPVDDNDRADVELIVGRVTRLLPHVRDGAIVIVSAQVPVGTTARFEAIRPGVHFAYSPENLRLGRAIQVFTNPDRVVVGVRDVTARATIAELLAPITSKIEWMSIESAEMTKHAINAFLALSVTYANELASICERVGADAKEVERGLKTESRIGPGAYLAPGGAFAGGTLARDVAFLTALGTKHELALPLLNGVLPSNEWHKRWAMRRLEDRLGTIAGTTIAVWGLTYKPGTDTLRRSAAVELCMQLASRGARVKTWDPAVRSLPAALASMIVLESSPEAAARGATALVIATEWPELRRVDLAEILNLMERPLVLDANRYLAANIAKLDAEYYAVGVPARD